MCPVSTEVLSVEAEVVNMCDVLGSELLTLGTCEVVVASGEGGFWEPVSARVWPLVVTSVFVVA